MADDLHNLELQFAKDPKSDVFILLCEAYIGQKRFMEAMVVCKKGIKNLPAGDARGRVLLARIYGAQGKGPKADQEFAAILQEFPNSPDAFAGYGHYLHAQGKANDALGMAQRALALNPAHPVALSLAQALGMAAPAAAPPQPMAAPVMAPPMAMPGQPQRPGMAPPMVMPGQPQRPGMAPPMAMPGQPLRPGMAPPAFGQPGMPGQAPFGQPGMPGQAPFGQPGMPGQAPFGQQANPFAAASPFGQPMAAPADAGPKLEHVDDFFSKEALGFKDDMIPDGMTAGPGRLTIIGFVPKTGGSIKVTLAIVAAVILAASTWVTYFFFSSEKQKKVAKIFREVKTYMDQDSYLGYINAIDEAKEMLKVDSSSNEALSTLAYASAVLAVDFGEPQRLAEAEDYLKRAYSASKDDTAFRVAARALIAYAKGDYKAGFSFADEMVQKGATSDLIDMERFRLQLRIGADEQELKKSFSALSSAVGSARVYAFLGYHNFGEGDITKADSAFGQALNVNRNHIGVLLGGIFTRLSQDFDLTEGVVADLKKVRALSQESSPRDRAMIEFAEGLLNLKLVKPEAAKEFFTKADYRLLPPVLFYQRALLHIEAQRWQEAIADLTKILAADPDRPMYLAALGKAQVHAKLFAEADKTIAKLAQVAPKSADPALLRGIMLGMQDKLKDARAELEKVPASDAEKYVDARLHVARLLGKEKPRGPEMALKYIEGLLQGMPPGAQAPLQARVLTAYGLGFEAAKQKDAAMEAFINARDTFRMYPPVHYHICRQEKGDAAKSPCKTYLRLVPWGEFRRDAAKRAGCNLDDLAACFKSN